MAQQKTLPDYENITIDEVRSLNRPTSSFICPLEANIYDIEFVHFKMRNVETNQVLFEIGKKQNIPSQAKDKHFQKQLAPRTIKYQFGPNFFKLGTLGTTIEFKVGAKPIKKFIMLEKHYFKGKLIKTFEFQVPFCMPNSTNSLEAVYQLPKFEEAEIQQMIKSPYQTVSDSFYFTEGKLIMHNKAEYSYAPFK